MTAVKINIDFANGTLNIEGDPEFVDKQIIRFENEIKQQLSKRFSSKSGVSEILNKSDEDNAEITITKSEDVKTSYEDVFEIHDDKLHIVKDIPGSSVKEKIICISLLFCLGKSFQGSDSTLIDDIRSECIRHGCMDSKNFSTYIKSYNTLMIDSGAGKSAILKLTMPGSKLAHELINRLRNGDIGDFFSTLKPRNKVKSRAKTKVSSKLTDNNTESSSPKSRGRLGPGEMLKKLAVDSFFTTPKSTDQIVKHCKDNLAFTYEVTELSSSLTRATRSGLLTRNKNDKGQYEYTSTQ